MRREFYDIYEDLYDTYGRSPVGDFPSFRWPFGNLRLARMVRRGIEAGMRQTPNAERCRPDAKLLLMVNFTELVAKPLAHPEARGAQPAGLRELEELIAKDTRTIIDASAESSSSNEITASNMFGAIASVYSHLRIHSIDLWG